MFLSQVLLVILSVYFWCPPGVAARATTPQSISQMTDNEISTTNKTSINIIQDRSNEALSTVKIFTSPEVLTLDADTSSISLFQTINSTKSTTTGDTATTDYSTTLEYKDIGVGTNKEPPDCELGPDSDELSQERFMNQLTHVCRYDRLSKPKTDGPLNITMQIDIKHIETMDQLQFKMHMVVQYTYTDERLIYQEISPRRGYMIGEDKLRDKIWIPHVVLTNERDTSIMGLEGKDVFVSISPYGDIVYSYRMAAMIYCWMDLKKFPFDEQICDMQFKSWTYNASQLQLFWEEENPVRVASQLHLTEFKLTRHWTNSSYVKSAFSKGPRGEYSSLIFKYELSREIGFYLLDYFLPSIMLVCTSWVTFWLQADNAAPRITLGTSTMLSFITLASGQSKTLPKVSYIKASEIWFLMCTMFIFASIAEFAFVNIIWRRKKEVELKKVNSKYIIKSAITPKLARKEYYKSTSMQNLYKSHSCSSLDGASNKDQIRNGTNHNNYLTVHAFPTYNVPKITMDSDDSLLQQMQQNKNDSCTTISIPPTLPDSNEQLDSSAKWTKMSPQEIAIWIDKRSRVAFPVAFLCFNILYWSFVYAL